MESGSPPRDGAPVDNADRRAKLLCRNVKRLKRQSLSSIAKRLLQVHAPNRAPWPTGNYRGSLIPKDLWYYQMKAGIAATGK